MCIECFNAFRGGNKAKVLWNCCMMSVFGVIGWRGIEAFSKMLKRKAMIFFRRKYIFSGLMVFICTVF